MDSSLLTWLILIVFILSAFYVPIILFRRAVFKVIKVFRDSSALCRQYPKKLEELGLRLPDFNRSLLNPKEDIPYALRSLIQAGIVRLDQEGRACLAEEKLPKGM